MALECCHQTSQKGLYECLRDENFRRQQLALRSLCQVFCVDLDTSAAATSTAAASTNGYVALVSHRSGVNRIKSARVCTAAPELSPDWNTSSKPSRPSCMRSPTCHPHTAMRSARWSSLRCPSPSPLLRPCLKKSTTSKKFHHLHFGCGVFLCGSMALLASGGVPECSWYLDFTSDVRPNPQLFVPPPWLEPGGDGSSSGLHKR